MLLGSFAARYGIICNASIMVFNLLPIPPLDGAKLLWIGLLRGGLRARAFDAEAKWGVYVIMAMAPTGVMAATVGPVLSVMLNRPDLCQVIRNVARHVH
jgi:Zn-dependent protease